MPTQGITVNHEQKLYVIANGSGYSCFGFDNAALHTMQMLAQIVHMERGPFSSFPAPSSFEHPLAWKDSDYGQLSGYEKYQQVLNLWCKTPSVNKHTYFDPGTDPSVSSILESARKTDRRLRLFLGDTETGRDWMDENDVVGRIGRSMGPMKVPLLIADGEHGGGAILTACIVRILDADTLRELYVHPKYQAPVLTVHPDTSVPKYAFRVDRDDQVQARFRTREQAHGYVAFMLGAASKVRALH